MQVNGRQAKTIKELKTAQLKFGADMLKIALKTAESLFKYSANAGEVAEMAWQIIENDPNATESDLVAARMVLVSLGGVEDLLPP
ncbi:hypothetical protein [Acidithiobacillus sp.]|uniref:hypothetical protein n=1 Tax=Acidithiobacillus sp. TaxID=1872118 RepID=UPI002616188F|nr:hypothetical protein [Acidithiobacillus sp.]MDD2748751.1 hypothetical protein [Acidithiobacillus sp.]MDD5280914.1 hypothetical protein [Acidithiobacillus sp.]